jgi:RNA polymerase sigma-70 factor (ECF subfamily)
MPETDDALLIALAQRGSLDAVAELFERYWPVAWQAAFAVTGNATRADDAAQDAIQRAFAALDRFELGRPFAPWLRRIAANRAIDELRRDRRLTEVSEDVPPLATIGADGTETGAGIVAAVAALPTEKRLVVVLRFWLDYTLEEIADSLEIPFGTVASRLSRALDDLRAQLEAADVA